MFKKSNVLMVFGVSLSILISGFTASADQQNNRIRVIGPGVEKQINERAARQAQQNRQARPIPQNPSEHNSGYLNFWKYGPKLKEGQVLMTGIVSRVGEDAIAIVDDYFEIDISEARVHFFHWFPPCDEEQEFEIEVGQRVSVLGEVNNTSTNDSIKAIAVLVFDPIHNDVDPDKVGIRGHLRMIDFDAGLFVITGIPVLFDDDTVIRPGDYDYSSIEPGTPTVTHAKYVDTDDDGEKDSLLAEKVYLRVCK